MEEDVLLSALEKLRENFDSKFSAVDTRIAGQAPSPPRVDYFPQEVIKPPVAAAITAPPLPEITLPKPPEPILDAGPSWLEQITGTAMRCAAYLKYPAIIAALGTLGLVGYYRWNSPSRYGVHEAFPYPYPRIAGLTLKEDRLVSVDPQSQLLVVFGAQGGKVDTEQKFTNPALGGLAWVENSYWSTNLSNGTIYQHNDDAEHTVRRTYNQANRNPGAIWSDGERLWTVDSKTGSLSQYVINTALLGTSLTPLKQYDLENLTPAAACLVDNMVWVFDAKKHFIRRYRLVNSALVASDSLDFSPWIPIDRQVTGFVANAGVAWVATENPTEIHRFDLRQLRWSNR